MGSASSSRATEGPGGGGDLLKATWPGKDKLAPTLTSPAASLPPDRFSRVPRWSGFPPQPQQAGLAPCTPLSEAQMLLRARGQPSTTGTLSGQELSLG